MVKLATAVMIILHVLSGGEVHVNTQEITNMRNPEPGHPNFAKDAHCLINMTDGRYVTVRETCDQVREIIGRQK